MKRLTAWLSALVVAGTVAVLGPGTALASDIAANEVSVLSAAKSGSSAPYHPRQRFAREFTKRGDRDASPYAIEHVHELQYRLRWAGDFRGPITGTFGRRTHKAVERYQRSHSLEVTGKANIRTWRRLIPDTVRGRPGIPHRCKISRGWHLCYDRWRHQVTLWHRGVLWNSWLVRGGDTMYPTRTGHFLVYARYRHLISGLYGTPMPYSQFFSGGEAFHGSRFMIDPYVDHSHGCVNMYVEDARQLWKLTSTKRLEVNVYGAWD